MTPDKGKWSPSPSLGAEDHSVFRWPVKVDPAKPQVASRRSVRYSSCQQKDNLPPGSGFVNQEEMGEKLMDRGWCSGASVCAGYPHPNVKETFATEQLYSIN